MQWTMILGFIILTTASFASHAAITCSSIFDISNSSVHQNLEEAFLSSPIFNPIISSFNVRLEIDVSADKSFRNQHNKELALQIIKNHHKESAMLAANLTPAEVLTILHYTRSGHQFINRATTEPDKLPLVLPFNNLLNAALGKLPSFTGLVRRNLDLPPDVLNSFKVGQVITQPTFTSTTKNLNSQLFSDQVRLIIHSKNGKDISKFSPYPEEKEVLFKTNTRFKILSIHRDIPHDRGGSVYRIELVEL